MKSDFEKRAAREAVEAVERRYERNQKAARQLRGRRRFGRFVICAVLLAGVLGLGRYFAASGVLPSGSIRALAALFDSDGAVVGPHCQYGAALRHLLADEVRLSTEMPEALKIKNAKPGVRYFVLTPPADGWFGLYELTRDAPGQLTVRELSPIWDAKTVTAAALREACAGKPYLVSVQGQVYLFGSEDLAAAAQLRSQVRALLGTAAASRQANR